MRRDAAGTVASQNQMRTRLTGKAAPTAEELKKESAQLERHFMETRALLAQAPNVTFIEITFEELLAKNDDALRHFADFCGIDPSKIEQLKNLIKT